MFKVVLPAIAAMCVSADLPVVEVALVGSNAALSAMEKTRENMENRFVAQLKEKVSALEKSSAPAVSRAISNVLDLHTFVVLVSVFLFFIFLCSMLFLDSSFLVGVF